MQLIRGYSPLSVFSPVNELERELERFFGRVQGPACATGPSQSVAAPVTDVREDENQFLVTVDLPGVKKENVQVSLHEGVLEVAAERREESEKTEGQYHRRERYYGKYARRFQLDVPVDGNGVKAAFKDGVLTVTVPKASAVKPKTIDIATE